MIKHVKTEKVENCLVPDCEECLDLLRALADKTRQEIIMLFVHEKELCANDIAKKFTLSRPTISHHLNLMKRAKILNSRKDGKEIFFSINKDYVIYFLKSMLNSIENCC